MWAGLIGAAATIGSSLLANQGAASANEANANINQENRDFNASQAEHSRNFAASQAGLGREFAEQAFRRESTFNAQQAALTRDFNQAEAVEARNFNSAEAVKNRAFQEYMSNTQYQRAIGDLEASGLNPMLAYSQGGAGGAAGSMASAAAASAHAASASAPGAGIGSSSPASAGSSQRMENELSPAINTGFRAAEMVESLKNMQAQNAKINAETDLVRAQIPTEVTKEKLLSETIPKMKEEIALVHQQARESRSREHLNYSEEKLKLTEERLRDIEIKLKRGEIDLVHATTELRKTEENLMQLQVPRMSNEAKAQESWWMKNVSPFLPDFLKSATGAAAISRGTIR